MNITRDRNQNGKYKWLLGEEKDESPSEELLAEENECISSEDTLVILSVLS